jgi:2,6-dihydroxypyridine 3-monooxygenase
MQDSERVLVIGGGIGGLTAAAALKAGDVPVEVFERQPELRDGRGDSARCGAGAVDAGAAR